MRNLVVIDDEQKYRDIIAEIAGGVLSKRAPGEWDVLAPNTLDEALDAVLDTRRDAGIVLIDGTLNTAGYQALKDPWASVREFENTRGWQVADHIKHDRPDTVRVSLNGSLHMGNHTDLEIK
ncbi:hypothetical protein HYW82_02050, partial [Candidatus Peregrinibacteria bacterium]|nr:hypothetical protein [Candidatus Peregrinibacteria bacterium]